MLFSNDDSTSPPTMFGIPVLESSDMDAVNTTGGHKNLLLFDANARLVVCNQRYLEMYELSPDIVKPGCSLQELLEYRIRNNSFSGNPADYRRELVSAMTTGKTTTTEVKSMDGRSISVINQPMVDGGWVAQ